MRAIKTILVSASVLIILAIAGIFAYRYIDSPEASWVTLNKAKIADVTPMLRLCSVDIYDDVPIRASIGKRHIFARVALNGTISFDLENISMTESADTLTLILPPEIVEIYESTDDNSYQVIDTWNDSFLGSSNFTTAEENKIKAKVRDNHVKAIYRKGYVKRARKEAAANLTAVLQGLTGKTVIVTDPSPQGYLNR